MPYRPRELVIRAREAAILLLRTIDRNEMVQRFLDLYSAQYRRPGRADHPALYREKLETIRREAILLMVLRIEGSLPRRLSVSVNVRNNAKRLQKKKGAKKKAQRTKPAGLQLAIPFLDLFREEFFVALGQALEWTEEDTRDFWRDLELYEQLSAVASQRPPTRRAIRGQNDAPSGPFVDRVGFLLDPSLLDQARREAAKFQVELRGIADQVLAKIFTRTEI